MNYTEKITLEQAIMLKKKQPFTQVKRILDGESLFVKLIQDIGIENLYANDGYILITRPDYAQYIIGNKPLPDGYGYPSKDLSIGIYDELPYYFNFNADDWSKNLSFDSNYTTVKKWYQICFRLTDLARVEAEAVVSKMEKTEINAAQCMWLINQTTVYSIFRNGVMVSLGAGYWIDLRVSDKDVYEILTTDYNSLPDEFKALADKPFAEKYKETLAKPKPSMPANFTYQNDEWLKEANKLAVEHDELKAKYSELEEQHNTLIKHLQEATTSAETKEKRIKELEHYKSISDNYVKVLEKNLNAIHALQEAKAELHKAHGEYYPY